MSFKRTLLVPTALVCVGLVLGLPGCSSFTSESPPLADSTFARVLVDMHLTSARAELDPPPLPGGHDSLLARYDVTRKDFDATLRYYSRRPKAFKDLYDAVIDSLNATQRRLQDLPDSAVPDSIPGRRSDRRPNGR